jgi:excisionase family DNA binding protein
MEKTASRGRVLYTVQEAADRLRCSDKSVYRKLKLGELIGGKGPGGIRLNAARVELLVTAILEGKI